MDAPAIVTIYKNSGKYFPTYKQAFFNGKITGQKKVYYVFTPTMQESLKVGEHDTIYKNYFTKLYKSNIFDFENNISANQLSLI